MRHKVIQFINSIRAGSKAGSAQSQYMKGNFEIALNLINKAISLDADYGFNPMYLSIKGKCHFHLNQKKEARECLITAKERLEMLLDNDDQAHAQDELNRVRNYIQQCG